MSTHTSISPSSVALQGTTDGIREIQTITVAARAVTSTAPYVSCALNTREDQ